MEQDLCYQWDSAPSLENGARRETVPDLPKTPLTHVRGSVDSGRYRTATVRKRL